MALVILCRKISASRKVMNSISYKKFICTLNTNLKTNIKAPILKGERTLILMSKRNYFSFFKRPTKEQLKIEDKVPDPYILIYRNGMDRYLFWIQVVSTVTALILIFSFIMKGSSIKQNLSKDERFTSTNNEDIIYIAAFIGFIVALQIMMARLPIRIYYFPQRRKYIFMFYGNYPLSKKHLTCEIGEVFPISEKGISPWKEAHYSIRGEQTVILLETYFRRSADLHIMLGVQRDHEVPEDK